VANWKDLVPKGWKPVSERPVEEKTVENNPAAQGDLRDPNAPPTIEVGTGRYYVIVEDPQGHQRAMFITAAPIPSHLQGAPPIRAPRTGSGQKPEEIFTGDLNTLDWSQAGPISDVPKAEKTPSPLEKWIRIDANGQPTAPNQPAVAIMDPVTGDKIALPDPAKSPQGEVKDIGGTMYLIKPDGTSSVVTGPDGKPLTIPKEKSQFNVAGIGLVEYDPATGAATTLIATPPDPAKEIFEVRNGKTFRWDVNQKQWVDTNLPEQKQAATVYNDPNSPFLVWYDDQGKEVARQEKVGYNPPRTQITTDTVSPNIAFWNPQTNKLEWQPNQNQVMASQAVSDLARSLGVNVAAGSMSEEQAQTIITSAVNAMNAQSQQLTAQTGALTGQANVAEGVLGQIQQGAQTGAGLLNQRVSSAQGLLQNLAGIPGQAGENMLVAPSAATAQNLVSGIQGWTTELGGGPGVYEAAANLVQRADPGNRLGGNAQQAYAGMADALSKFQALTGAQHPLQQGAMQPMPATGGFNPGAAQPAPNPMAPQPPNGQPRRIVQPKRPQAMQTPLATLGAQTAAATRQYQGGFGAIGANPMLAAMQRLGGFTSPGAGGAPVTININP